MEPRTITYFEHKECGVSRSLHLLRNGVGEASLQLCFCGPLVVLVMRTFIGSES